MASRQAVTRLHAIFGIVIILLATSAGIWWYTQSIPEPNPAPFSMEVLPRPLTPLKEEGVLVAMGGQRVVFLVVVENTGAGSGADDAVDISATGSGATVSVTNPAIKPGAVAEVTVIPDRTSTNTIVSITITGDRGGVKQTETVDIQVRDWEDDLGEDAAAMRDMFVPWLATNHPELGITSKTGWIGTIVNPGILVVMHYLFYSEEWEMYVTWHVMIPPYDWTKIYLRPRFTETRSTLAFEISSVQGGEAPQSIELPDWV